MRIIYRKKFKKLREEYQDLGETKLDLLEELARSSEDAGIGAMRFKEGLYNSVGANIDDFDDKEVSRSMEYFLKFRKLIRKHDNVVFGILGGATLGLFGWVIKKGIDSGKDAVVQRDEYTRGRRDAILDLEASLLENDGEEIWVGDTIDEKHMFLRCSDDEPAEEESWKDIYE